MFIVFLSLRCQSIQGTDSVSRFLSFFPSHAKTLQVAATPASWQCKHIRAELFSSSFFPFFFFFFSFFLFFSFFFFFFLFFFFSLSFLLLLLLLLFPPSGSGWISLTPFCATFVKKDRDRSRNSYPEFRTQNGSELYYARIKILGSCLFLQSIPANLHANRLHIKQYNSNNIDYRSNDEKDDNVGGVGGGGWGRERRLSMEERERERERERESLRKGKNTCKKGTGIYCYLSTYLFISHELDGRLGGDFDDIHTIASP